MIDREKLERLIAALERHGRRWKVGDDASEKRSADCTNAADNLRALSARVAELEKERDEWASMVGQVVACLPLPEVISASSTIGDLISALKEKIQSVDEARARVAAVVEEAAQEIRDWGTLSSGVEDVSADVLADILALATDAERDALAERDKRIRAEAYRDGWVNGSNGVAAPDFPDAEFDAPIRKGDEE